MTGPLFPAAPIPTVVFTGGASVTTLPGSPEPQLICLSGCCWCGTRLDALAVEPPDRGIADYATARHEAYTTRRPIAEPCGHPVAASVEVSRRGGPPVKVWTLWPWGHSRTCHRIVPTFLAAATLRPSESSTVVFTEVPA